MEDEELTQEQRNNSDKRIANLLPHQYKKGQSGNPGGRPKGISMKEYLRNKLASMDEDERENFLQGQNKIELFKMAEGNPDTKTDITTKGEKIEFTPAVAKVVDEFESKLKEQL